jgi:hypothetical protein
VPDPASQLGSAPTLPCVSWLWILPPCSRGLWRCHMSSSSGSRLPVWKGSGTATCPAALDPASLLERALVLSRIPWLCILPLFGRAPALPRVSRRWILPPAARHMAAPEPLSNRDTWLKTVGHVTVLESSQVGRQHSEPRDIWQRRSPPEQRGEIQSHGIRGSAGVLSSSETEYKVVGHVIAPEPY